MAMSLDVAIIGGGPYGLSIAAHLRASGVAFRIFGSPMQSWRERMPADMLLKSEGFASNLYDPSGAFTLKRFCEERNLPYADIGLPVSLSTLIEYGMAFQQRMVPELEDKMVAMLDRSGDSFILRLADGETVVARRVLIAVGLTSFHHVPRNLAHLPADLLSHSADHRDLYRFRGRDVTVIGGGASALDIAASLWDCGAEVRLVARRRSLHFNPRAEADRPLWQRIRYPVSGIGFGLRSRFYTDAPMLFHYLPERIRLQTVRSYLGPAGGHYVRDRIMGRVPLMLGYTLDRAETRDDRVKLRLLGSDGDTRELITDHIVAATGYRADLRRLAFMSEKLRSQLRSVAQTPVLSANFQSSISGLYFVGLASANSFGPMMRFMFGAGYTARRLSRHLAQEATSRQSRLVGLLGHQSG
jgi:thioredoxin reductase